MHIFRKLAHIFGKLAHICEKLVHVFARKLVSRTSKQVLKVLGPLWQPGGHNDTKLWAKEIVGGQIAMDVHTPRAREPQPNLENIGSYFTNLILPFLDFSVLPRKNPQIYHYGNRGFTMTLR